MHRPTPDLHLESETEFWVRLGRGSRRPVQPGDHVPPDAEIVQRYPRHFVPSGERVNVVWLAGPTPERRRRLDAEQARLLARPARIQAMVCENCGERSPEVIVPPDMDALAAADLLSRATDSGDDAAHQRARWQIQQAWKRHRDAAKEFGRVRGEFLASHVTCDPSRELHPPAEPPEVDPTRASWWTGPVSSRGEHWPGVDHSAPRFR